MEIRPSTASSVTRPREEDPRVREPPKEDAAQVKAEAATARHADAEQGKGGRVDRFA